MAFGSSWGKKVNLESSALIYEYTEFVILGKLRGYCKKLEA
jgi:hypothetical protein